MNRYELGKLVQWAGALRTRKRIQKVTYLLQSAGCPFDARYFLHHYGPYSSEVACLTDALVQKGLLSEEAMGNVAGRQFNYRLSPESEASLLAFEQTPAGQELLGKMEPFEALAKDLLNRDLQELEYASTIAYFRNQGHDWPEAIHKGCRFKQIDKDSNLARRATKLAKQLFT